MVSPTLAILLFSVHLHPSITMLLCDAWSPHVFPHNLPSLAARDCQNLIAYLPSHPALLDLHQLNNTVSLSLNLGPLRQPSAPFFPQASLSYNTCVLMVNYYAGSLPANPFDVDVPGTLIRAPPVALHEASILKIWQIARDAAERIVSHCVLAHGREGGEADSLNLPEMDAWYKVEVSKRRSRSWPPWSAMTLMPLTQLSMSGVLEVMNAQWTAWLDNVFAHSFYHI